MQGQAVGDHLAFDLLELGLAKRSAHPLVLHREKSLPLDLVLLPQLPYFGLVVRFLSVRENSVLNL